MDAVRQLRLADDLVRRLSAALRAAQLYAPAHPLVARALGALSDTLGQLLEHEPSVPLGVIGQEIVVGTTPLPKAGESFGELLKRLGQLEIERIAFERGVTPDELQLLVTTLARPERAGATSAVEPGTPLAQLAGLTHIRVGRLHGGERTDATEGEVAQSRQLYGNAVGVASTLWDMAQLEGMPDPGQARSLVDSLAQAVSQNRTALMALTALKEYDNYTFTHMVNVCILTMAQARSLGVDGSLLREFGIAGLMHDIGKVRTPRDILNKPDKLNDEEFALMRLHVVDGAAMLRRTPDIPPLAPIVAFEHHLRLDGTGYPFGVRRSTLNLCTMLCSIADVYDAMRSRRAYQSMLPTERILAVLQQADGMQFDQHLVRRFTQLMGMYPPGNLVRLDTGEVAVVVRTYGPDPRKPRVRVILDARGTSLLRPYDVSLWQARGDTPGPRTITAPVDPKPLGIDPLAYL